MTVSVVETSLASMLLRKDTRAEFYRPHLESTTGVLSFQTVAEMRLGAMSARWGTRRLRELDEFLSDYILVPYTHAMVSEWARITNDGRKNGRRLETADAWIAATAATLEAPLLRHDGDFDELSCPGVTVIRYDDAGSRLS